MRACGSNPTTSNVHARIRQERHRPATLPSNACGPRASSGTAPRTHSRRIVTTRVNSKNNIVSATSDDDLEELLEECDLVESGIDVAEFDGVSVELSGEDLGESEVTNEQNVMVWAGYMQRDLEPPPGKSSPGGGGQPKERAVYRDDIASIDPESQAVRESSASRFFDGDALSLKRTPTSSLTEWDLRAAAETKKWFDDDYQQWQEHRKQTIGQYPSMASDWRTDVRISESLDPAEVDYREWTMKEMWDLITQNGQAADPRDVPFQVRKPGSRTNFVEEGYSYNPSIPEWLDMQGKLMKEDDTGSGGSGKRDGHGIDEAALLASEFSDFDADFEFSSNTDESV
jgi:hypothetical protein